MTFTVIGPVMMVVSNAITDIIVWLYQALSEWGIFGGAYSLHRYDWSSSVIPSY